MADHPQGRRALRAGRIRRRSSGCAGGFQFTEGPLWCPDGSLLFQDIKAERTYRLAADRSLHVLREQTGAANGQTFVPGVRIVFCEQNGRRVSRMARDGSGVEPVVETWAGAGSTAPTTSSAGPTAWSISPTRPTAWSRADERLHFQGVYALDLERGGAERPPAAGR